ncbi:facilitated trehalose transporter Tret1-like isoform X1 [Pieris napi]|uniref:facilitated trehalose transporter Tret1-like isoform X1 n=1 Tax=Pieris napi TaxID=78633 RepID=UPI001FBA086D|nr:facilitated trehalose transporter Tret1-like isoform X1 [Pieris napi]
MTDIDKSLISPFIKQCFVCATVCMNVLSNGCAYGFPAVLLPQLKLPDSPIPLTKAQESWIASVVTIAMLVGNFSMPAVMDRLGRKKAHFIVMIPTAIGWLLIVFATNVESLILARIMHGLSLGQVVLIRAVIIGEYTSPRNRGAFLTLISVAQSSGVFFVHLLGSLVSWQITAGISVLFTILSFVMTFILPESPSWLANNGRYNECEKHFRWLRGDGEDEELNELIQARIKHNTERAVNIGELIRSMEFYKPIIISLHVSLITYFSGAMTIAVYGTTIVSNIMGSDVDAHFWLVCLDVTRIVTSFLAVYLIRTFKRRTVLFNSVGLCLLIHVLIISYVCVRNYVSFDYVAIPALLLILQCVALSSGILPMNNVIVGEIFPLAHRSIGISVTTAMATGFHFAVLKTFPYLLSGVGIEGVYGIYASVICYGFSVIWFAMPETKGRTLQQIEDRFKGIERVVPEMESLNNNLKC